MQQISSAQSTTDTDVALSERRGCNPLSLLFLAVNSLRRASVRDHDDDPGIECRSKLQFKSLSEGPLAVVVTEVDLPDSGPEQGETVQGELPLNRTEDLRWRPPIEPSRILTSESCVLDTEEVGVIVENALYLIDQSFRYAQYLDSLKMNGQYAGRDQLFSCLGGDRTVQWIRFVEGDTWAFYDDDSKTLSLGETHGFTFFGLVNQLLFGLELAKSDYAESKQDEFGDVTSKENVQIVTARGGVHRETADRLRAIKEYVGALGVESEFREAWDCLLDDHIAYNDWQGCLYDTLRGVYRLRPTIASLHDRVLQASAPQSASLASGLNLELIRDLYQDFYRLHCDFGLNLPLPQGTFRTDESGDVESVLSPVDGLVTLDQTTGDLVFNHEVLDQEVESDPIAGYERVLGMVNQLQSQFSGWVLVGSYGTPEQHVKSIRDSVGAGQRLYLRSLETGERVRRLFGAPE